MTGIPTEVGTDDVEIVRGLRAGEEAVFAQLVRMHDPGLRRMARMYVADSVADDVVQDTWMTVIRGIEAFGGRSTLKTWIFGILVNIARRRGEREGRTIPYSTTGTANDDWNGPVSLDRLHNPDLGGGYWPASPTWARNPESAALAGEAQRVVTKAIAELTPAQREVMTLRDVWDWSAAEVCEVLGISDVNQRTLLHRARVGVRARLEEYFDDR